MISSGSSRRYGVLGAGAVGTTYGATLWSAGHPVRFCLRSDLEEGLAHGLRLDSPWGDVTVPPDALCGSPAELAPLDVLLVALKSTANERLASLLARIQPPPPWILLLQNGLGGEELAAAAAPAAQVLGGICDVACSRVGPAQVRHYAYGQIHLAPLQSGEAAETACQAVAADLVAAGVPVSHGLLLRDLRWRKLVWNMAFSGLCTLSGLRTLELLADPSLRQRLLAVMGEVAAAAAADGARLQPDLIDDFLTKTEAMPSYAPSMQLDAEAGRPLELEAIYRVPLQRAASHGLAMLETRRLLQQLEALAV
ncbi:MAG: 2-dehydropantoate 2-reductase [Synechococcaceae cyanobacterium]|nr:2-dehydropantoate 2-reductase [Synechococcaceae cyanobacterium]